MKKILIVAASSLMVLAAAHATEWTQHKVSISVDGTVAVPARLIQVEGVTSVMAVTEVANDALAQLDVGQYNCDLKLGAFATGPTRVVPVYDVKCTK